MSYNYNWQFNPLESYPTASGQTDVVFLVHWQCYASTGSMESASYYQDVSIGVAPVTYDTGSTFIPFNELTKDTVYSWVEHALGSDQIEQIKVNLVNKIEDKINPKVLVQTAPWI
jgi:hypothetical protein